MTKTVTIRLDDPTYEEFREAAEEEQEKNGGTVGACWRHYIKRISKEGKAYAANHADQQLLSGLINLTDAIADQAHDKHGLDCLLDVAVE